MLSEFIDIYIYTVYNFASLKASKVPVPVLFFQILDITKEMSPQVLFNKEE